MARIPTTKIVLKDGQIVTVNANDVPAHLAKGAELYVTPEPEVKAEPEAKVEPEAKAKSKVDAESEVKPESSIKDDEIILPE